MQSCCLDAISLSTQEHLSYNQHYPAYIQLFFHSNAASYELPPPPPTHLGAQVFPFAAAAVAVYSSTAAGGGVPCSAHTPAVQNHNQHHDPIATPEHRNNPHDTWENRIREYHQLCNKNSTAILLYAQ